MDSEAEAQWDLNSIKRYEKLLMFDSEYPVRQMELVGNASRLCCLSDKQSGNGSSLLTVYNLPPRLSSSDSNASLSPDFDLKIIAGTFNNNHITEIGCLESCDWVVASEVGASELLVYKLNTTQSDKLIMSGVISCEGLTNPTLSVTSDTVIVCQHSSKPISLIDIKNKRERGRRKWSGKESAIRVLHLSAQEFVVYSTLKQLSAALYDSRQQTPSAFFQGDGLEAGCWTAGCGFKEGINSNAQRVAFLSDEGNARFYDLRKLDSPYSTIDLGSQLNQLIHKKSPNRDSPSENLNQPRFSIKLNPLNDSVAAVSGLDSRVYIVDTKPNCSVVFTHDGHEHMESSLGEETVTTSHMFYHPGGPHSLISSSDNCSINCWTFNNSL